MDGVKGRNKPKRRPEGVKELVASNGLNLLQNKNRARNRNKWKEIVKKGDKEL